ncbi:protein of unknown function [Cupriavidus taiwanensis]|uniref:Uncharacterized protein n=1 Tax=Cupriavidus taiwanensis TaxID=164546 RepID=A0A7Z7NN14_9BURK|nr:protein of unknown function [Cupriavidus taiwanensis]SOZ08002.1 hypothetical protein CBM2597_A90608 [Cupriavidus taiwanensis]SPC16040.1 hypothetical protein CBM2594_A70605 [Cupriavidus taiwanensis]SPD40759.1 protein of unknown function [Cupriavidus taiwanensis]
MCGRRPGAPCMAAVYLFVDIGYFPYIRASERRYPF